LSNGPGVFTIGPGTNAGKNVIMMNGSRVTGNGKRLGAHTTKCVMLKG